MCFTSDRKLRPCIYLVSLAGAFIYWTMEAVMENGFITEQFSLAAVFPADPGVLWFRILAGFSIVAFAISYQERFENIKALEQELDVIHGKNGESQRTYISLCSSCQQKEQHVMTNDPDMNATANVNMHTVSYGRGRKVTT